MDIKFNEKTVIVTGVVGGIGRSIAQDFANRGARVYASDLHDHALRRVVADLTAGGGDFFPLALDVGDGNAVSGAVESIVSESPNGRIDIVVHAAGGVRGQVAQPVEKVSDEEWHGIFEANVTGVFNLVRAVTPHMKQAGKGRIVTISSRAGLGVSLTGIQSYAMSKAGQIGLVRQLAHELGPFGITVNSVAPGFMLTNPDTEVQWASYGADGQKAMIERTARRRLGKPEDISNAVMFFASDYADWITGQTLAVTGSP